MQTQNLNVQEPIIIPSRNMLVRELPASDDLIDSVAIHRREVMDIFAGSDPRLLIVAGPCAARTYEEVLDVAKRLIEVSPRFPRFKLGIRINPDKPRSEGGWPGNAEDPDMDGSFDAVKGSRLTRRMFRDVAELGLPVATEVFGPSTIHKVSDVTTLCWIGARSISDPYNHKIASGLSPVLGFKNDESGSVTKVISAIRTASKPNRFRGPNDDGIECIIPTLGNSTGFAILRGSTNAPNYDAKSVERIREQLERACVCQNMMIDVAHGNCTVNGVKIPSQQCVAALDVINQVAGGNKFIKGIIIEADLEEGKIAIPKPPIKHPLRRSITDPCISMDTLVSLLEQMHSGL